MPVYKLTYFDARGFAEPARLLFHLAGIDFKDERLSMDNLFPGRQQDNYQGKIEATPLLKFPVLSVDGFEIPQSSAICRYLARKFGFAGKTPEEEAWVDAIVDQFKDFSTSFRPFIIAVRAGKPDEEVERIRKEVFNPARDSFFEILNGLLEKSNSGFLVGDGLTWADLVIADNLHTLENLKLLEEDDEGHRKLKKFKERIYGLEELEDHISRRPEREM